MRTDPPCFLQSAIGEAPEQPTGYIFGATTDETSEAFTISEDAVQTRLGLIVSGMPFAWTDRACRGRDRRGTVNPCADQDPLFSAVGID